MIDCTHRDGMICLVASEIAGHPAECNESACEYCAKLKCQGKPNRVTVSLAINAAGRAQDREKTNEIAQNYGGYLKKVPVTKGSREERLNGWGAGSQLKKILSTMGINPTPSCPCLKTAIEMDEKGPDWCDENLEKIVNVMKREAAARNWPLANTPLAKTAARRVVVMAIKWARKEGRKRDRIDA